MLKRLWLLLSVCWALLALWSGVNRGDGSGIQREDCILAALPLAAGWLLARAARFVVTGSPRRARGPVPYRRP